MVCKLEIVEANRFCTAPKFAREEFTVVSAASIELSAVLAPATEPILIADTAVPVRVDAVVVGEPMIATVPAAVIPLVPLDVSVSVAKVVVAAPRPVDAAVNVPLADVKEFTIFRPSAAASVTPVESEPESVAITPVAALIALIAETTEPRSVVAVPTFVMVAVVTPLMVTVPVPTAAV